MRFFQKRNRGERKNFKNFQEQTQVKILEINIEKGKTYLIFDELQTVKNWEKAIESLRIDYDVDIYTTGSNAYLLSTEFSTLLSGRYVEIRMLPLSFKEFLTFWEFETAVTMEEKFQQYLRFGGMPTLREYGFNEQRSNQAFVFYSVGRYDVKGKQLLKTLGKNYIVDLGFRNILLGYCDADQRHILENVVFLELIRRDYRVYMGKVGENEVDFVAEKPGDKLYMQVTESMGSPETRQRELRPLMKSADDVMTPLVHLGYLAFDSAKSEVYIPNREVADEFKNAIEGGNWDVCA